MDNPRIPLLSNPEEAYERLESKFSKAKIKSKILATIDKLGRVVAKLTRRGSREYAILDAGDNVVEGFN